MITQQLSDWRSSFLPYLLNNYAFIWLSLVAEHSSIAWRIVAIHWGGINLKLTMYHRKKINNIVIIFMT